MDNAKKLKMFTIKVFPVGLVNGEPETEYNGNGDEWRSCNQIKQPGFDGAQTINLDDLWLQVFSTYPKSIEVDVIGYETIVKYNNTQQLTEKFTIVADFCYE
ncbi:MAG: hypothetical protein ACI93R_001675 [Flavobacteriales bacterium]|jgi:hypothetical protein